MRLNKLEVGNLLSSEFYTRRGSGGNIIITNHGEFSEVAGWIKGTQNAMATSGAWTANEVGFFPVMILQPISIQKAFWYNAGTVAGTCHVGIYNLNWKLLASANAAMSGASSIQTVSMAIDIQIPDNYFLAFGSTSSTAIFQRSGGNQAITQGSQWKFQASAIPLPDPASPSQTSPFGVMMGVGGTIL